MRYDSEAMEKKAALDVAAFMVAAARTAPKGCGVDEIEAVILDGAEKDALASEMRNIAETEGYEFFARDAGNVDSSHCVVIIGIRDEVLGLPGCGLCGFENCGANSSAGARCAFKITDLGIAVGSAVSVAANHRIDSRVMYSVGKAALNQNLFSEKVKICYGIPLSTLGKSPYFDREPSAVSARNLCTK